MLNKKLYYLVTCVLFSGILSAATTYLYGSLFMHERYWLGTIERVNETQVNLLNNLLPLSKIFKSKGKEHDLDKILEPLSGKIHIVANLDNEEIYSNLPNMHWKVKSKVSQITLPEGIELIISTYEPPTWNYQYLKWIKNPNEWLTPSKDFITVPFAFFSVIYLLAFYVFAWRMKAYYLAEEVLEIIRPSDLIKSEAK